MRRPSALLPIRTRSWPSLPWLAAKSASHWASPGSALARRSRMASAFPVSVQSIVERAFVHEHIADLVMEDGEIALPLGGGRIGLCEAVGDGEAVAVGLQSIVESRPRQRARRLLCRRRRRDRAVIRHLRGRPWLANSLMARLSRYAFKASSITPWARSTSPTLL